MLDFDLPDLSVQKLKSITVSAVLAGSALSPEVYTTAGAHQYRREAAASVFTKDVLQADFTVAPFLQLENDGRPLGLVVTAIALEPK